MNHVLVRFVVLAAALAGACGGPRSGGDSRASAPVERTAEPPRERLWTRTFLERAALSAGVVEIEGPDLLRERLALRRDELVHEHSERTERGVYVIEQRQRPDSDGTPIRAQLDELVVDAYERITVRIRPDARRVVLRASGEAFMLVLDTGRETRTHSLTLVGELDAPLAP